MYGHAGAYSYSLYIQSNLVRSHSAMPWKCTYTEKYKPQ